jgi:hypothetical protein
MVVVVRRAKKIKLKALITITVIATVVAIIVKRVVRRHS